MTLMSWILMLCRPSLSFQFKKMSNSIHLTNAKGRDATVGLAPVKGPPAPKLGLPDEVLEFRRYLAAGEDGTHAVLQAKLGEDYASALVEADPEADLAYATELARHPFMRWDGVWPDWDRIPEWNPDPERVAAAVAADGRWKAQRSLWRRYWGRRRARAYSRHEGGRDEAARRRGSDYDTEQRG